MEVVGYRELQNSKMRLKNKQKKSLILLNNKPIKFPAERLPKVKDPQYCDK